MEQKRRKLAVSVNTLEALILCCEQEVSLFCIENPLYSALSPNWHTIHQLHAYKIEDFQEKQIALCKRVQGNNIFDPDRFEVFYLPLSWEGWHS